MFVKQIHFLQVDSAKVGLMQIHDSVLKVFDDKVAIFDTKGRPKYAYMQATLTVHAYTTANLPGHDMYQLLQN